MMRYRELGATGLMVSEIGFGAEWVENHTQEESTALVRACEAEGINILDCWMSNPEVRTKLGNALADTRDLWIIQGHIGATWQEGQYKKSRVLEEVRPAFEDLLERLGTDHIELGMIHYVDKLDDWKECSEGPFFEYVCELRESNVIEHIGLSTHNPEIARLAALSGFVEVIMFSINPAFDMLPPTDDLEDYYAETYDDKLFNIDPAREALYALCEEAEVGITVMKPYAGGRLLKAETSAFGVALTPLQCLHYCLTRPAVASVLAGYDTPQQVHEAASYATASERKKDYATVLATAPCHTFSGQCTYCNHCKPCPANIDIAMVNKLYDLAVLHDDAPESVFQHYLDLEAKAGDCTCCAACEARCPFGVPIVARMAQTVETFGE